MTMNVHDVITGLRALADELKPFINEYIAGSMVLDATKGKYVPVDPRQADRFALAWWSTISTLADILELQPGPLTAEQRDYLKRKLFGGMGSFADFSLDVRTLGAPAHTANQRLDAKRSTLFKQFQ